MVPLDPRRHRRLRHPSWAAPGPRRLPRTTLAALAGLALVAVLSACRQSPPAAEPAAVTTGPAAPPQTLDPWAAGVDEGSAPEDTASETTRALPMPGAPVAPLAAASAAARLTRVTEPGCCTQPEWSADGRRILFIDRPEPGGPTGIWAADPDQPGAPPELVTAEIARYSAGLAYRFDRDDDTTTVTRLADERRWDLPTASGNVLLSPDGRRAAWLASPEDVPAERRTAAVWVADLAGGAPREVASVPRGSLSGWLGDTALLVRGRDSLAADDEVLWAVSLADGTRTELARARRVRGELASPDGRWVAYYVTQQPEPAANGLWLASPGGGAPRRLDSALFGAYAWRDGGRLLIVPLDAEAATHRLVELDAATLSTRELVDPANTPFTIANGDWAVSPDGRRVAFVEGRDKAIWVLELP